MEAVGNFIGGEWTAATQATEDINPSDTRDVVGLFSRADAKAAEQAVAAARDAFVGWSRSGIAQRHDILKRVGDEILARKDELGRLLSREEGKTLAEAVGEAVRAGQIFLFFAGECLRLAGEKIASVRPGIDIEITREPLGVVGIITPWNFPIAIPAWKIAPALAYGNCVVFKPADLVPGTAHALVDNHRRCRHAARRLQSRHGSRIGGRRGAAHATPTWRRSRSPARSATGRQHCGRPASSGHEEIPARDGRQESAGRAGRCRIAVAVECAANGAFFSTGQRCTASSRLIVTEGIHDRFVQALTERMQRSSSATRSARARTSGRPSTRRSSIRTCATSTSARQEGARLVAGRRGADPRRAGLLRRADALHRGAQRHADRARGDFRTGRGGHPRQDYDAALALANDTPFGLCAGICTTSLRTRRTSSATPTRAW